MKAEELRSWAGYQTNRRMVIEKLLEHIDSQDIELARLREIAIEATATRLDGLPNTDPCEHRTGYEYCELLNGICDGYPHMLTICPIRDHWRAIAARELDLKISQEAGYVKRLEEVVLFHFENKKIREGCCRQVAVDYAQAALAKIKEGEP
jgi:hypothetical protein